MLRESCTLMEIRPCLPHIAVSMTKQHGCFALCRNLSRLEAKTIIGVFQGESRALLRCSGSFRKGQQADKAGNDALMHVLETSKIVSCQD